MWNAGVGEEKKEEKNILPASIYECKRSGNFCLINWAAYCRVSGLVEFSRAKAKTNSCTRVSFRTLLNCVNNWGEGLRLCKEKQYDTLIWYYFYLHPQTFFLSVKASKDKLILLAIANLKRTKKSKFYIS